MIDAKIRQIINPTLDYIGNSLSARNISANNLTYIGFISGILSGFLIFQSSFVAAIALIVLSRLADGLDGAVARATAKTDFGGYLDIVCDFVFYLAIPLGFALRDPENLLPAITLIASFTLTGVSFLAFAAIAAKRGLTTERYGPKSFYYASGLAEGGETIAVFIAACVWPQWFGALAYGFASLCIITVLARSVTAFRVFGETEQ